MSEPHTIAHLLSRYYMLQPPHARIRRACARAVKKVLDIDADIDVEVKGTVVTIKTHPGIKSSIILNKRKILIEVVDEVGSSSISDIR